MKRINFSPMISQPPNDFDGCRFTLSEERESECRWREQHMSLIAAHRQSGEGVFVVAQVEEIAEDILLDFKVIL